MFDIIMQLDISADTSSNNNHLSSHEKMRHIYIIYYMVILINCLVKKMREMLFTYHFGCLIYFCLLRKTEFSCTFVSYLEIVFLWKIDVIVY